VGRRCGDGPQIASETEVADGGGIGAVFVPDYVQRRAGAELPADDGAAADAAEIEIGIADRAGERRVIARSGGYE